LVVRTSEKDTIEWCRRGYEISVQEDVQFLANYMLSPVHLSSVCLLTFVRPTQVVQIFRNISMALGIMAIH